MTSSTEHHQVRAKIRRQFQNKKGIKAAIKRDNPGVEDLTTVPRWARVTELNHAITNAKIDASRLLAQEIVATAVAYDNCLIMRRTYHSRVIGGVSLMESCCTGRSITRSPLGYM